jgi:hypothetical protein
MDAVVLICLSLAVLGIACAALMTIAVALGGGRRRTRS